MQIRFTSILTLALVLLPLAISCISTGKSGNKSSGSASVGDPLAPGGGGNDNGNGNGYSGGNGNGYSGGNGNGYSGAFSLKISKVYCRSNSKTPQNLGGTFSMETSLDCGVFEPNGKAVTEHLENESYRWLTPSIENTPNLKEVTCTEDNTKNTLSCSLTFQTDTATSQPNVAVLVAIEVKTLTETLIIRASEILLNLFDGSRAIPAHALPHPQVSGLCYQGGRLYFSHFNSIKYYENGAVKLFAGAPLSYGVKISGPVDRLRYQFGSTPQIVCTKNGIYAYGKRDGLMLIPYDKSPVRNLAGVGFESGSYKMTSTGLGFFVSDIYSTDSGVIYTRDSNSNSTEGLKFRVFSEQKFSFFDSYAVDATRDWYAASGQDGFVYHIDLNRNSLIRLKNKGETEVFIPNLSSILSQTSVTQVRHIQIFSVNGDGQLFFQVRVNNNGICNLYRYNALDKTTLLRKELPCAKFLAPMENNTVAFSDGTGIKMIGENGAQSAIVDDSEVNKALSGEGLSLLSVDLYEDSVSAIAPSGEIYFTAQQKIFKVASDRSVTHFAGSGKVDGPLGDQGPAKEASLNGPASLLVLANGDLLVADSGHHRIRRISKATQTITTIAGSVSGFQGDGGPAIDALLNLPSGMALKSSTNEVYFADSNNHRVRKINLNTAIIQTEIGNGVAVQWNDIPPYKTTSSKSEQKLQNPVSISFDEKENLLIYEKWGRISVMGADEIIRFLKREYYYQKPPTFDASGIIYMPVTGILLRHQNEGTPPVLTTTALMAEPGTLECGTPDFNSTPDTSDVLKSRLSNLCRANVLSISTQHNCHQKDGKNKMVILQNFKEPNGNFANEGTFAGLIIDVEWPCKP